MLNTYGPPETTLTATWCEMFPGRPITLGFPLPTYHIYILDDQLRLVEDGESGEICIGGPGVAICYINRPDTHEGPLRTQSDLARSRDSASPLSYRGYWPRYSLGEIEYLGRIDVPLKIPGSELCEPGETSRTLTMQLLKNMFHHTPLELEQSLHLKLKHPS